jgi:Fe-S-cluster-containing dehydrogenase component
MKTKREQLRIDPAKCTACNLCTMACAIKHHGIHGMLDPHLSRIKIHQYHPQELNVPEVCMACENAPCINVCPVNARMRISNGSVVTNVSLCIGCHACVYICPVGSPQVNPDTGQTLTCDMCAEDKAGPWCVIACQEGALTLCDKDSLTIETVRNQAGRFKRMHA